MDQSWPNTDAHVRSLLIGSSMDAEIESLFTDGSTYGFSTNSDHPPFQYQIPDKLNTDSPCLRSEKPNIPYMELFYPDLHWVPADELSDSPLYFESFSTENPLIGNQGIPSETTNEENPEYLTDQRSSIVDNPDGVVGSSSFENSDHSENLLVANPDGFLGFLSFQNPNQTYISENLLSANPDGFLGSFSFENPHHTSENLLDNSGQKTDLINLDHNEDILEMNRSVIPSNFFEKIYSANVDNGSDDASRNHMKDMRKKNTKASAHKKRKWIKDEDRLLIDLVNEYGDKNWAKIATKLSGRDGKQCRDRWYNQLHPDLKSGHWSEEEERRIVEAHMQFGNKWEQIAKHIPGRSGNSIKNHWNTIKRRKGPRRGTGENENHGTFLLEAYIKNMTNDSNTIPTSLLNNSDQQLLRTMTSKSTYPDNNNNETPEPYTDFDEVMTWLDLSPD